MNDFSVSKDPNLADMTDMIDEMSIQAQIVVMIFRPP